MRGRAVVAGPTHDPIVVYQKQTLFVGVRLRLPKGDNTAIVRHWATVVLRRCANRFAKPIENDVCDVSWWRWRYYCNPAYNPITVEPPPPP